MENNSATIISSDLLSTSSNVKKMCDDISSVVNGMSEFYKNQILLRNCTRDFLQVKGVRIKRS